MLRRRLLLALCLATAACTPTQPAKPDPPTKPEPPTEPEPPPTVVETPPAAVASAELWRWSAGPGEWGDNLSKRSTLVVGDATFTLGYLAPVPAGQHQADERFGITCTGPDGTRWQAELGTEFVGAGAMVAAGERIYATHHSAIASGAEVSAVDVGTGQVRWKVALEGLGPVAHSKYRNETQLELDARGLVIYGKESSGAYVEVLDPETGKQRSLGLPDPRFVSLAWEGKGPDAPFPRAAGRSALVHGEARFVLTESDEHRDPPMLERSVDGHTSWILPLQDPSGCGRATMRVVAEQLWVASYCGFSSGAELLALDPTTGQRVHETPLHGLGPIAHSEYFNEVELDELFGHVVVRGREAAGRYIEVVDPASGAERVELMFFD